MTISKERAVAAVSRMHRSGDIGQRSDDAAEVRDFINQQAARIAELETVLADTRRLTRDLDVAMNGKTAAAEQASLCDLVAQVRKQPATKGKNRHGLDAAYFHGKLTQIVRDIDNFTPAEMARSLARYAVTADEKVVREPEFQQQPPVSQWGDLQLISDAPAVHEALKAFSHDSTEDNAVAVISAVMESTKQQPAVPQGWRIERLKDGRIQLECQKINLACRVTNHIIHMEIAWQDMMLYHLADALLAAAPQPKTGQDDPTLLDAAQFLLDRLSENEPEEMSEDDARSWYGHVVPAIERLKMALSAAPQSDEGEKPS